MYKLMEKQNENYIKAETKAENVSFTIYNLNNEEDVKKKYTKNILNS